MSDVKSQNMSKQGFESAPIKNKNIGRFAVALGATALDGTFLGIRASEGIVRTLGQNYNFFTSNDNKALVGGFAIGIAASGYTFLKALTHNGRSFTEPVIDQSV
jgi:hypothetical protein